MSFVELTYLPFLAMVLVIYWASPGRRSQNLVLALASAAFYGWVHPWFLTLLYGSCVLDWATALGMARWPARKGVFLGLSLVGNLGLLATFKYFDFFANSVAAALGSLGLHVSLPLLHLALPVGISFYTFQTLSYTIDVWRGQVLARRSLLDFTVFVSLFPQLVAGPVERARDLLPQVEAERRWDTGGFAAGVDLCLRGAVWKVVVADTLGLYVDRVFLLPSPSFWVLWAGVLGFTVQILADFGGYTLLARGSARMLGFQLVENFKSPYLASTPAEFWRRWHTSFSSWIHEYVYLPLRGVAPSASRRTLATFAALGLSGLWHGASWNFVLWGLWHALLLTGHRAWSAFGRPLPRSLAVGLMFVATMSAWLIFREHDVVRLMGHISRSPFTTTLAEAATALAVTSVAAVGGGLLWVTGRAALPAGLSPRRAALARGLGWAVAVTLVVLFGRDTTRDFLYFRF